MLAIYTSTYLHSKLYSQFSSTLVVIMKYEYLVKEEEKMNKFRLEMFRMKFTLEP